MKYIDLESYPRRTHFAFFKEMAYPYVGLTANVDVTGLIQKAKELGGSTFLACLWAVAQAANAVPELRQRVVEDRIVEFDHCDTAHTVALPDRTFCNCRTDCRRTLAEFLTYGKAYQEEAMTRHGFAATQEDETNLIFVSCVPWVSFTQVIQPAPLPADYTPRIVMGKYIHEGARILLPLHIQCNHALVDGWHISEFFRLVEQISRDALS